MRGGGLNGLKIGLVTDNPITTIGGVERFSLGLIQELETRGARTLVYDRTVLHEYGEKWLDRWGFDISRRCWVLGVVASRLLAEAGADIIIQNGISGWSLRRLAQGIPRVVVHHGTWRGVAPNLLRPDAGIRNLIANRVLTNWQLGAIEKWTSGNATSVAVSPSVATELRDIYGLDSLVIQNGVELQQFVPGGQREARETLGLEIPAETVVVIFPGRVEYGKGSDLLSKLALRAREHLPEAHFLICTDREWPGWPSNVTFLTNLPHQLMPLAYRASNVFLFPSRYEGCSLSVIEAMACGLAPLLSDVGHAQGIPRDVPDLHDYILPDFLLESWWSRLALLIQNPDERKRCGVAARRYVEAHHSLEAMGDAYEKLILELIGGIR